MNTLFINHMVFGQRELHCDYATQIPNNSSVTYTRHGNFQVTEAHPLYFTQQLRWCDVLYLHGGETLQLIDGLRLSGEWRPLLTNKIICVYSAGVSALAQYSFNVDHKCIVQGLGILPFNTIVHYNPTMWWMADDLMSAHPHTPILTIADTDKITMRLP